MPEKREEKSLCSEGALGLAGFVLGIISIVFIGWAGIIIAIVGFFLCLYQQKKHPTKAGKVGLRLNIIGFILGIVFLIIYTYYLMPVLQELIQQTQTFPTA